MRDAEELREIYVLSERAASRAEELIAMRERLLPGLQVLAEDDQVRDAASEVRG